MHPLSSSSRVAPRTLARAASLFAGAIALCGVPAPLLASEGAPPAPARDLRWDPSTGRDGGLWRKNLPVAFSHVRVELDIPDASVPIATGLATLSGTVAGLDLTELTLDCKGPRPSGVAINGVATPWTLDGERLLILPARSLRAGSPIQVQVKYALDSSTNKGNGLTWSPADPNAESATDRAPVIHAQGQAEHNSRWFPIIDAPSYRLTSEVIVTVDANLRVLSNGTLLATSPADTGSAGQPRTRWHWRQDQPHVPYLITLAIGDFALLELPGPAREPSGTALPMPVYVPHGKEAWASEAFARTPEMVTFLAQQFDEPYPWSQYAQAVVRGFVWGGMENTAATLLTTRMFEAHPADNEALIVHELAHQWMGNLITCRHWDHLWLNEGWATYAEVLWAAHQARGEGDDQAGARAYREGIASLLRSQVVHNAGSAPFANAMGGGLMPDADAPFLQSDDPYAKGALVLHMLRTHLGEGAFWRGVRAYVDEWKFRQAETDDFRRSLEAASGRSLEHFFEQWVRRPGLPRLRASLSWEGAWNTATIDLEQTQTIDRFNPAYVLSIPVVATYADGRRETRTISIDARSAQHRVTFADAPQRIELDPDLTLMATFSARGLDIASGATMQDDVDNPARADEPQPQDAAVNP